MLAILPLILPILTSILGKIIPDAGHAAQASQERQKALIERQGEIDKTIADDAKAQADVNLEASQHPVNHITRPHSDHANGRPSRKITAPTSYVTASRTWFPLARACQKP